MVQIDSGMAQYQLAATRQQAERSARLLAPGASRPHRLGAWLRRHPRNR